MILTHGISISKDGQSSQHGANHICDGVKIVAAELSVASRIFVVMNDLISAAYTLIGSCAQLFPFLTNPCQLSFYVIWGFCVFVAGREYGCPTACGQVK